MRMKLASAITVIFWGLGQISLHAQQLPSVEQLYGKGLWAIIASGSTTRTVSDSYSRGKRDFSMPDYTNTDKWYLVNADVIRNPSDKRQKILVELYRSISQHQWIVIADNFNNRRAMFFEVTGKENNVRISQLTRLADRWIVDVILIAKKSCKTDRSLVRFYDDYPFQLAELAYNFLVSGLTHSTLQTPLVVTCDGKPVTFY